MFCTSGLSARTHASAEAISADDPAPALLKLDAVIDSTLHARQFRDIRSHVDLATRGAKLLGLLAHACFDGRGIVAHVLCDLPGTELRTAHRAEVRDLRAVGGQRFVVIRQRGDRIEREVELISPTELEARL